MEIIEEISKSIIEASTTLTDDKLVALENAIEIEDNENARWALSQILENYKVAEKTRFPLCDDTGIPHVIIEAGCEREITGDLLNQIHEGIALGLNNLPARPMATYKREISPDTLNLHFILEGGGPEIRAKTYRVYHKRSFKNVIDTAIDWLSDSLNMLGCTPSIPSIGIGRTHYEANALLLKSVAYGNLTNQSDTEIYVNSRLNDTGIGPLGFGGKTTVLGSYVNVGNQRASGVRIVAVRPSCFVEPRVATLKL